MSYIISFFLVSINYMSSLYKNKSKLIKLLLLGLMWILFWGSIGNVDYNNYLIKYNYLMNNGGIEVFKDSEIGFNFLMKISGSLGLEYEQFLMIVSFIGLLLVVNTVVRYSKKSQLVYSLYFIYPFLIDVVQVRHFLAMSIIIFSLRYIIEDERLNNFKFIVGVLLGFTIHYISIFFLPIIFLKKIELRNLFIFIVIFLIVTIPLAYTNIFEIIATFIIPDRKVTLYFENRASLGFITEFLFQSLVFLTLSYCCKNMKLNGLDESFCRTIYKINVYMFILFPLYIINGTFSRAYRMIMIPNYIIFSLYYFKLDKQKRMYFKVILLVLVLLLFMWYIYIPSKETVFYPIFQSNTLFNKLK